MIRLEYVKVGDYIKVPTSGNVYVVELVHDPNSLLYQEGRALHATLIRLGNKSPKGYEVGEIYFVSLDQLQIHIHLPSPDRIMSSLLEDT